jgi:hypothetical protein
MECDCCGYPCENLTEGRCPSCYDDLCDAFAIDYEIATPEEVTAMRSEKITTKEP